MYLLEILAIVIRVTQSSSSTVLQKQALMILRNLAFSSTHKTRIVAECKFIYHKIIYLLAFSYIF